MEYEQGTDVTSAEDVLECIVVTPEETALQAYAQFVALPLFDGELGVSEHHSPFIGRLGYGELRLVEGGTTRRWFVDGGFVQVANDIVTVLTGRAIPAEKINVAAAQEQLREANHRLANTPELEAIRDRLILQARAQIRVAQHANKAPHSMAPAH